MGTPVTGIVESIESRNTTAGVFYDIKVNGQKYGNGKFAPRDIQQGDMVTFEFDVSQRGQYTNYNIKARTLRKVEGTTAPTPAPTPAAAPARKPYEPFDERQDIISKQAALNSAIEFGNLAMANGAVLLPKAAKEGEKLGLLHNWVMTTAANFYNHNTGRTWEPRMEEEVAPAVRPKAPAKPAKPAAEDTGNGEWSDEFADDDIPF